MRISQDFFGLFAKYRLVVDEFHYKVCTYALGSLPLNSVLYLLLLVQGKRWGK